MDSIARTDGTITMKNGQTREATKYAYANGTDEVMYLTTGLNRSLKAATPAQAATFAPTVDPALDATTRYPKGWNNGLAFYGSLSEGTARVRFTDRDEAISASLDAEHASCSTMHLFEDPDGFHCFAPADVVIFAGLPNRLARVTS